MTSHVGQATTCVSILPNNKRLGRLKSNKLSSEAKFRLRFIDNYRNITNNVTKTCKLFGITRSLFYKWYKRFNPHNLATLENKSSKPHRVRSVSYSLRLVKKIRQIREDKDTALYSAKKIAHILARDYMGDEELQASASTVGRIIKRFNLFFTEIIQLAKKRSKRAIAVWKKRKPTSLHRKLTTPRQLIEFDMKHIRLGTTKYYAFCAIDVYTREALIHIANTSTSRQAKIALKKVRDTYGSNITILNDNGSENLGQVFKYLKEHNITQYFARPYQPKDKPYIERLIGSYQRECLDQYRKDITNLKDLRYYTNRWLNNYHYYRPHDSLNKQTPDEYCATLNITIKRREVSMM